MSFFASLTGNVEAKDSLLCVGLDPHPELLPDASPQAATEFCLQMIDATSEFAAAYKPNAAFFEALGSEGWRALEKVVAAIPDGTPVILDAKRGDIPSTARAYATAAFEVLKVDAITASPYLGRDALEPMLQDPEHGVFLLCRTSNPGADALQSVITESGAPLYLHVARLAAAWNQSDNLGLVVSATVPRILAGVRAAAPDLWFLTPGVGAQGGELRAALQAGLRRDGLGMLINVSRSLATAPDVRGAAEELRAEINAIRHDVGARPESDLSPELTDLADALFDAGCVKFGRFVLKSGMESPIYFDLRLLASEPKLLARVASAYAPLLEDVTYDRLAPLPYAALPIGTAIALQSGRSMIYPRLEAKDHGRARNVEGAYVAGETAVVIDDLATTGVSKFEAIRALEHAGLVVRDVVVLIDRQSGASEALAASGYRLHAVLAMDGLLEHWGSKGKISQEQVRLVREFLRRSSPAGAAE
jgi:uridine monophosphate synthetase